MKMIWNERIGTWEHRDPAFESDISGVDTGPETLVQQSFAEEVDINTIVRRFGVSGELPFWRGGAGIYGDFTDMPDFSQMRDAVERANARFESLPATVRERFGNDPAKLVEFATALPEAEFLKMFEEAGGDPAALPASPVVPAPPVVVV